MQGEYDTIDKVGHVLLSQGYHAENKSKSWERAGKQQFGVLFIIEINDKGANIASVVVKGEAVILKRNWR